MRAMYSYVAAVWKAKQSPALVTVCLPLLTVLVWWGSIHGCLLLLQSLCSGIRYYSQFELPQLQRYFFCPISSHHKVSGETWFFFFNALTFFTKEFCSSCIFHFFLYLKSSILSPFSSSLPLFLPSILPPSLSPYW